MLPDTQPPKEFYNDVHVLICEKGKWKWHNTENLPGDVQKKRGRHAACLIPVGKKVVVFGGMSEDLADDGNFLDSASGYKICQIEHLCPSVVMLLGSFQHHGHGLLSPYCISHTLAGSLDRLALLARV